MLNPKNRTIKLWSLVIISALFITVATGFFRDLLADAEETYKGLKIFSDVIELVEQNYVDPVDTKELIRNAIQGMVHSLDPHSSLLPPEAFEELQMDTQGKFTGIGVSITMRDGFVTVISPIEGTPAFKAGIEAGDKIVKVDGELTKDLREAVKTMRGPKGTTVVITIKREGVTDQFLGINRVHIVLFDQFNNIGEYFESFVGFLSIG
ncbi:S41 family peptidase [Thermodesulfobacteriota bacterium]